jgi:hypothetical protein
MEFCNSDSAFSFLCIFMRDPFNMVTLRSVLAECSHYSDVSRFTDGEICQQLACLIAHGLVTDRREYASEPADEEQTVETLPSLVPAGAAAAQATTMMMAAESGAPFCES